jgi:hypothetical protein
MQLSQPALPKTPPVQQVYCRAKLYAKTDPETCCSLGCNFISSHHIYVPIRATITDYEQSEAPIVYRNPRPYASTDSPKFDFRIILATQVPH